MLTVPLLLFFWRMNILHKNRATQNYKKTNVTNCLSIGIFLIPKKRGKQEKNYNEQDATERNAVIKNDFDASVSLSQKSKEMYMEISFDKNWLAQKRKLVTTELLGKVIIPNLPFENTDGSGVKINTDYFGKKRNVANPSPGPFEIVKSGKQTFKVWPK